MSQQYSKSISAKATIGEANAVAKSASYPAIVAARFALTLSILACLLGAVAIALAVRT